jgi:hypothetical protein
MLLKKKKTCYYCPSKVRASGKTIHFMTNAQKLQLHNKKRKKKKEEKKKEKKQRQKEKKEKEKTSLPVSMLSMDLTTSKRISLLNPMIPFSNPYSLGIIVSFPMVIIHIYKEVK